MKITKILCAVAIVATALPTLAQDFSFDAFRFSGANNSATARFNALGGSQTALGGDLTSLYGNPAGLGMFTKSEFSFTPSFNINNNETNFLDTKTTQNTNHVNLNNMGIVFHSPIAKTGNLTSGLLSFNFGVGYQKTNFFKNDINYRGGKTFGNGLGDYFSEVANVEENRNTDYTNVPTAAFNGFLIDTVSNQADYYKPSTSLEVDQLLNTITKGNQSNVDFSMGVNIGNQLYLGATLGLASINYRSNNVLNERGTAARAATNRSYNYSANLINNFDAQGSGVNFKIGAILKPVYEFRIGLSLETPTWYAITDNFNQSLNLRDIGNRLESKTDNFLFDYRLSTPLKLNGGISYFISNKGFLTANINFIDYSGIRIRSNDSATDLTTNAALNDLYKEALNYSFGAEFKLVDNFMIRGGYNSLGNPYHNKDFKSENFSGGLGYRFGSYYIDGAVIFNQNNLQTQTVSYSFDKRIEPFANRNTQTTNVSLTFGARF